LDHYLDADFRDLHCPSVHLRRTPKSHHCLLHAQTNISMSSLLSKSNLAGFSYPSFHLAVISKKRSCFVVFVAD
jgi:hypothetical protein